MSWHETETNILRPHAFFGGKVCWLKNGEIKCGMPYENPIHKLPIEPCNHSFVCEMCGDTASEVAPKMFNSLEMAFLEMFRHIPSEG